MAKEQDKSKILELFKKLDKDNDGYLDRDEVKKGLGELYANMEYRLTEEDIDKAIESADKNGDGKISPEEFIKLV